MSDLAAHIRDIPDFPKPGIQFKDITPLLSDPSAFGYACARLAAHFAKHEFDVIAAAEARGFLFAAPMALELRKPLVPLPDFADAWETQRVLEAAMRSARERSAVKITEVT